MGILLLNVYRPIGGSSERALTSPCVGMRDSQSAQNQDQTNIASSTTYTALFIFSQVSRCSKTYCCKSFEVEKLIHASFLQFDELGGATVIKYPYVMSIQIEFTQKYQIPNKYYFLI